MDETSTKVSEAECDRKTDVTLITKLNLVVFQDPDPLIADISLINESNQAR